MTCQTFAAKRTAANILLISKEFFHLLSNFLPRQEVKKPRQRHSVFQPGLSGAVKRSAKDPMSGAGRQLFMILPLFPNSSSFFSTSVMPPRLKLILIKPVKLDLSSPLSTSAIFLMFSISSSRYLQWEVLRTKMLIKYEWISRESVI